MFGEQVQFIPVTEERLEELAPLAASFGMPRSVRYFRRILFNPESRDVTKDPVRGYMIENASGERVGLQCFYYVKLYARQQALLGKSGCFLGMNPKYGEFIFDLMNKVILDHLPNVGYGNCIANKKSYLISTVLRKGHPGPKRCRFFSTGYPTFWLKWLANFACPRRETRSARFFDWIWLPLIPLNFITAFAKGLFAERAGYSFKVEKSFTDERFLPFWERFLASNEGVISSRAPQSLRWMFDESLQAGADVLITAEKDGQVDGYILLRKYQQYKTNFSRYKIIDICAVGNDYTCLRVLVKAAMRYAALHRGTKVQYIGGHHGLEVWLDPVLTECQDLGFGTTTYGVNSTYAREHPEVVEMLQSNKGWFFGPFDGERCMGHGGYVDL